MSKGRDLMPRSRHEKKVVLRQRRRHSLFQTMIDLIGKTSMIYNKLCWFKGW